VKVRRMRAFPHVRVVCAILAVLLTSCSVAGSPTSINGADWKGIAGARSFERTFGLSDRAQPFVAQPNAKGPFLYSCSVFCVWFKEGVNRIIGQITPSQVTTGIGVDPVSGDVYVSMYSSVSVYAPNSTTLLRTLSDPSEVTGPIAVDGRGTAFVVNSEDTSFGPGSISVYPAGATTPSRIIRDPNVSTGLAVAVDEHNLLVFCFVNLNNDNECDEFPHARGKGIPLITGIMANGVSFDDTEHLVVMDSADVAADTFEGSTMCGHLVLIGPDTGQFYFAMALPRGNKRLFANNDLGNPVGDVEIGEFAYADCMSGTERPAFVYDTTYLQATGPWIAVVPAPRP